MLEPTTRPLERWMRLQRLVTTKVEAATRHDPYKDTWLIPRLRGLERMARNRNAGAQTLQILESGRRVLGDSKALSPFRWPDLDVTSAEP